MQIEKNNRIYCNSAESKIMYNYQAAGSLQLSEILMNDLVKSHCWKAGNIVAEALPGNYKTLDTILTLH